MDRAFMNKNGKIDFAKFYQCQVDKGLLTYMEEIDGYTEKSKEFFIQISRSENDPPVKYKLHKLLSKGISGSVYSLITCDDMIECKDLVAKTFSHRQEYFDNEQDIMDIIAQRQNPKGGIGKLREHYDCTIMYELGNLSDKFVKRVAANRNKRVIIYNRGEKLQRPITRKQFEQMFDCMRELRNIGIINRDIMPEHFLSTKASSDGTEKIFLVGFSSGIYIENEPYIKCSDAANQARLTKSVSISTLPTEILNILFEIINNGDDAPIVPYRRHDLESFVKTFYLLYTPEDNGLFRNDADFDTRIKCAHEYWHNFENKAHSFWKEALEIAKSGILERLYNHLKHFQLFKFECSY